MHKCGTMQSPRSRAAPLLCQQRAADPLCPQHKAPLPEEPAPGSYIIHKLLSAPSAPARRCSGLGPHEASAETTVWEQQIPRTCSRMQRRVPRQHLHPHPRLSREIHSQPSHGCCSHSGMLAKKLFYKLNSSGMSADVLQIKAPNALSSKAEHFKTSVPKHSPQP